MCELDSYFTNREGEESLSQVTLRPPDCGHGCCEHAPPLRLCSGHPEPLTVLWTCLPICLDFCHVPDSERNTRKCISQGPHQNNSYRTHATQVRCYLFLDAFLVPSPTRFPRPGSVSGPCALRTSWEVSDQSMVCSQMTYLSLTPASGV